MRTALASLIASLFAVIGIIIYASGFDQPPDFRTFFDRNGEFIGTIDPACQGAKIWTPLADIPESVVKKTIRSEDRFFYLHRGINPVSTVKAAFENILSGRVVRGGSTITQQLAKNLMQEREGRILPRTLAHKLRESVLAVGLELKHTKGWILERYLNTAYYGRRAYGVAAAANVRLAKRLDELTEDEIDFLVKLPKAPNRGAAKYPLSQAVGVHDGAAPVGGPSGEKANRAAGRHFIEFVRHGTAPGDIRGRIDTTLDLGLQRKVEDAVQANLSALIEDDPLITAAAVVIDVKSGDILAMEGSRDYFDEMIGGAVNAAVSLRQPGSALKPFTYFAAFARGFAPGSVVPDEPLSFSAVGVEEGDAYAPQNFDRRFHGEITIREALANSYNVPAVVTLNEIGLSFFHDTLKKFGFTHFKRPPPYYGLAVTLGSGEVTLLELTNAYAALARGGAFLPYRFERGGAVSVASPVYLDASGPAAQVTSILSDPDARLKSFGANESMGIEGHRVAVKTGTSYEHRDNWAVGYSPSFAVGVWVGHANGSPMDCARMTGAAAAAPVWHAIMETLLRGRSAEDFPFMERRLEMARPEMTEASIVFRPPAGFALTSPVANTTYRIHPFMPPDHQRIAAKAKVNGKTDLSLSWRLDGELLDTTSGDEQLLFIAPRPGRHRLEVESSEGERQEVSFRVIQDEFL